MRWVNRYLEEGEFIRHNRKPIAYKVTKEQVKFILDEIKKKRTITTSELMEKINEKFQDNKISRYHISRIIKDNNVTLKLKRMRHEPIKRFGVDININNQLKEFYIKINRYNLDNIICIDESSFSILMKRNFCYSPIGKRCVIKTLSQEVFKKYTGIFAINSSGCIGWELYLNGGITSERLKQFINKNITLKYRNKLIILDNASSHRNDEVKQEILKKNKLLYAIPYQHFTNGIEQFFSVIKSKLKKEEIINFDDIKLKLQNTINTMNKDTYKNIINGTYKRNSKEKYNTDNIKNSKKNSKNYK